MTRASTAGSIARSLLMLIVLALAFVVLVRLNILRVNQFYIPELVPDVIHVSIVCPDNLTNVCQVFANSLRQFNVPTRVLVTVPYNPSADVVILYRYKVLSDMEFQALLRYVSQGGVVILADGSGVAAPASENATSKTSIKYVGLGAYLASMQGINPSIHFDYKLIPTGNGSYKPEKIYIFSRVITNTRIFGRCNHELMLNETSYNIVLLSPDVETFNVLKTNAGDIPAILVQPYGRGYIVLVPYNIFMDQCSLISLIKYLCANKLLLAKLGLS
jgi:hypothetical protein